LVRWAVLLEEVLRPGRGLGSIWPDPMPAASSPGGAAAGSARRPPECCCACRDPAV
jgi:hypothetical protein